MTAWLNFLRGCERSGAVLLFLLAAVFALDVVLRYALGTTASWLVDLEWYLGAAAICLSLAPALAVDAHVRVDVVYARCSSRTKRAVQLVGHLILLLPWCAFVVYAATWYTYNSYLIGEGSPDPGGLPYRWAAKAAIPLAFAALGIEGLRQLIWPAQLE